MTEGHDRFDQLGERIDKAFAGIDAALIEGRQYTEFAYDRLDAKMEAGFARIDHRFAQIDGRLDRIERKLDTFIDVQTKTNELMDRRLRLQESR